MNDTMPSPLRVAFGFEREAVSVTIDQLIAMRPLRPDVKMSGKYRQIVTSIKAIGLVEPPVVIPATDQPGTYYVLDGHLRLEALKDLGILTVECLIARDDETYTYNKQINRLSPPQEHRMIARAIERGVSEERLAEALGINVTAIQRRARLMDGIGDDTIELLKDAPCPLSVFDILRKMAPMRQREAAELMVGHSNFRRPFVMAILAATPDSQLAAGKHRRKHTTSTVTREQVARLERELATLQVQIKAVEETYGLDNLHLTVAKTYLARLLTNAKVVRWLAQHKPEYLTEFQTIAELQHLPTADLPEAAE
jgi:hypothetical protein